MTIHVVQPGDTLDTIADQYGVAMNLLAKINGLTEPFSLVTGEVIVILFPEQTYIIQEGDTIFSIADSFGVDIWHILRNNPDLLDRDYLQPGDQIIITYTEDKVTSLITNGYTYPFINKDILRKTLPFLTYLTIFNYQITSEATLIPINDEALLQMAKEFDVAPIMLISPLTTLGVLDATIVQNILNNISLQNTLIYDVLIVLKTKGYNGVNIDFQYIHTENRQRYVDFVERFTSIIKAEGFQVFLTISPSMFELRTGQIHQGIDYNSLSEITDRTILLAYDWCTVEGFPLGFLPLVAYENYLNYVVSQINPNKLVMGISTLGYIWQFPYVSETPLGNLVSYQSAIELAGMSENGIQFNEPSATPYFYFSYINDYFVWFRDARSIDAYLNISETYGFNGIAYWNIMFYNPQAWLVINSQYEIIKLV